MSRRDFFSALLDEKSLKDTSDEIESSALQYVMWIPIITTLALLFVGEGLILRN
jgi:hypothetical protein